MDLWTLIITLDVPGQMNVIRLVYKDKDRANDVRRFAEPTPSDTPSRVTYIKDDYGREITVRTSNVIAVQLSHLPSEFESEADIAILQGHAQNKLQRRAAADPMLKQIHPANGPLPFMPQGRG